MTIRTPLLALVAAAMIAPQAMANDSYEYPYAGLSGGEGELCEDFASKCSGSSGFFRLYSGARLLPYFGSEVGYTHFRSSGAPDGGASITPRGLDVVGNLFFPLGQNIDLFAKAGVFAYRAKINRDLGDNNTEEVIDFKTGIGARIGFGHTFSLRVDADYIPEFGNSAMRSEFGNSDLLMLSAGVQLSF